MKLSLVAIKESESVPRIGKIGVKTFFIHFLMNKLFNGHVISKSISMILPFQTTTQNQEIGITDIKDEIFTQS